MHTLRAAQAGLMRAVLRLPQMKDCVATIQAVFEGGEVSVIGTIDVCKVKLVRLIE